MRPRRRWSTPRWGSARATTSPSSSPTSSPTPRRAGGDATLAGAVVDGVDLSAPASAALRDSLPALAAMIIRTIEPGSEDVAAAEPEPEPVLDEPAAEAAEHRAQPPAAAAERPDVPAPAVGGDVRPARTPGGQREPVLPAVLASALLIVVAVAVWLIL